MNNNTSPIVLFIAWINFFIAKIFSTPVLSKIALILSIIGSIFYIYNQIIKFKKNKDNVSKTN
jgi:hypothetical protein